MKIERMPKQIVTARTGKKHGIEEDHGKDGLMRLKRI
jgi:hypothetical protein